MYLNFLSYQLPFYWYGVFTKVIHKNLDQITSMVKGQVVAHLELSFNYSSITIIKYKLATGEVLIT